MGILEKLLETDAEKLKSESVMVEVKRLSEKIGEPFILTMTPLTAEQVKHIGEIGNVPVKVLAVLEACRIEEHKLSEPAIMEKFGFSVPEDFVQWLFIPGEIYSLYNKIENISGYSETAIEDVKK